MNNNIKYQIGKTIANVLISIFIYWVCSFNIPLGIAFAVYFIMNNIDRIEL